MSNREIDRLRVIRDVMEKKLTWSEAGRILKRGERTIGRLVAKVRKDGNQGILHGLRGRPSNHRLNPEVLEQALGALHHPDYY